MRFTEVWRGSVRFLWGYGEDLYNTSLNLSGEASLDIKFRPNLTTADAGFAGQVGRYIFGRGAFPARNGQPCKSPHSGRPKVGLVQGRVDPDPTLTLTLLGPGSGSIFGDTAQGQGQDPVT